MSRSVATALLALTLAGCAAFGSRPQPLSEEDLVRMTKNGASAQAIVERLESTGTVIFLSASDIVRLHRDGVAPEVLDWLQRAQIEEIARTERFRYAYGPYYGGPYFCPGIRAYPHGPWRGPWIGCY